MKKLLVIGGIVITAAAVAAPWTKGPAANRPTLFKTFGSSVNTPEGLALDKAGNLYLSAINGVDPSYSGHIWKRCAATGKWSVFAVTRTDTKSGKSFPQGIVFGDDGNLYYAENQSAPSRQRSPFGSITCSTTVSQLCGSPSLITMRRTVEA